MVAKRYCSGMKQSASRKAFTLRFRDERTHRALQHAARELGMSMNELAERAIEHELAIVGAELEERLRRTVRLLGCYRAISTAQTTGWRTRGTSREPRSRRTTRCAAALRSRSTIRWEWGPSLPIPWNDDPPGAAALLRRNLEALLSRLIEQAPDRLAPTVSLAQGWHRSIFHGVVLPSRTTLPSSPTASGRGFDPFANGNGRTARLWANWCALRYGLPLFVRLRPRAAGSLYAAAAADSMAGDHRATISLFAAWLEERLRAGPGG